MRLKEFKDEVEKLGFEVNNITYLKLISINTLEGRVIATISKTKHCKMEFWPNAELEPSVKQQLFYLCYLFANTTVSARAYEEV